MDPNLKLLPDGDFGGPKYMRLIRKLNCLIMTWPNIAYLISIVR